MSIEKRSATGYKLFERSLVFISLLISMVSFSQSKNNDWENPQLVDWNKEKPHATFMAFDKKNDVIADEYNRSPFFQSLNGTWKFVYADKYADRPLDFYKTDLNDSKWNNIPYN